jgi:hypothetical protein
VTSFLELPSFLPFNKQGLLCKASQLLDFFMQLIGIEYLQVSGENNVAILSFAVAQLSKSVE